MRRMRMCLDATLILACVGVIAVQGPATSGAELRPSPHLFAPRANGVSKDVIASVMGKRRMAVERILGLPLQPPKTGRDGYSIYNVQGLRSVYILWSTRGADSKMELFMIGFETPPGTWQEALQSLGYSIKGVRLVGEELLNIKGLPHDFSAGWMKTSIIFTSEDFFKPHRDGKLRR